MTIYDIIGELENLNGGNRQLNKNKGFTLKKWK